MYYYADSRSVEKLPIVFVPGLFGSLGDDILPGSGEFSFGMAEKIYRPIIEDLEELGYKEGEDLFISFYDWRKGCQYNVQKYLLSKIDEAKKRSRKDKVDIIGHSLGGLVARTYIQGPLYNYDVRNLIMMGTPNAGAVNAYYFWSGGQLPYDKLEKNVVFQLLKFGFLWIYRFIYGPISDLNILRKMFPVGEELLPSIEYGNYLFYENNGGIKKPVPIENMEAVNRHLNQLNKNSNIIFKRGVKPYHIIGTGFETTDIICVNRDEKYVDRWFDGKPIYSISMPFGDGTITINSAEAVYSKNYYLNSNHGDILRKSKDILASILMRPAIPERDYLKETDSDYVYSIILRNISNAEASCLSTGKTFSIMGNVTTRDFITRKVGDNLHWIMISSKEKERIRLKVNPQKQQNYEILVFFAEKNGEIEMIKKNFDFNNTTVNLFGTNCL